MFGDTINQMYPIRIKYADLVLSDSENDSENISNNRISIYKKPNNYNLLKNKPKNKFVKKIFTKNYKVLQNQIKNLSIYLRELYDKINNTNKKIYSISSELEKNKQINTFISDSLKFLEKDYIKILNSNLNKINSKPKEEFYLDSIYSIRFNLFQNYNKIIEINKNILLDLNDDTKLLFGNSIFDFNLEKNINSNLINYFKNKINKKKIILDKYFYDNIQYYKFIKIIQYLFYNYLLVGIIIVSYLMVQEN